MVSEKLTLLKFIEEPLLEKKKKKKKKKKSKKPDGIRKGSGGLDSGWYSHGAAHGSSGMSTVGDGGGGGMGESLITELLAGITPASYSANVFSTTPNVSKDLDKDPGMTTYPSENPEAHPNEEEAELQVNKVDQARQLFQSMISQPNATRADIINAFMKDVGVTNSTGVSYYTRFMKEAGLSGDKDDEGNDLGQGTGMGDIEGQASGNAEETPMMPPEDSPEVEDPEDNSRAGVIRTVDDAHLVYKRASEDGTFKELWIYNLHDSAHDELKIRRAILAGTDIPPKKTKSADGAQKYTISTMGNAQMLEITGLNN